METVSIEGEYLIILAYVLLFCLILVAIVVVWDGLFEPPIAEILDDKPWKPSGSYWADCMRRGDCYCTKPKRNEEDER